MTRLPSLRCETSLGGHTSGPRAPWYPVVKPAERHRLLGSKIVLDESEREAIPAELNEASDIPISSSHLRGSHQMPYRGPTRRELLRD